MNSKTVKELVESLLKAQQEYIQYSELEKLYTSQGKKNLASTNRANCALLASKIDHIKKEINRKLNQPAYKIKLLIQGEPKTGFLTNINKDEIPDIYKMVEATQYCKNIQILEIEEIHPYLFKD